MEAKATSEIKMNNISSLLLSMLWALFCCKVLITSRATSAEQFPKCEGILSASYLPNLTRFITH